MRAAAAAASAAPAARWTMTTMAASGRGGGALGDATTAASIARSFARAASGSRGFTSGSGWAGAAEGAEGGALIRSSSGRPLPSPLLRAPPPKSALKPGVAGFLNDAQKVRVRAVLRGAPPSTTPRLAALYGSPSSFPIPLLSVDFFPQKVPPHPSSRRNKIKPSSANLTRPRFSFGAHTLTSPRSTPVFPGAFARFDCRRTTHANIACSLRRAFFPS